MLQAGEGLLAAMSAAGKGQASRPHSLTTVPLQTRSMLAVDKQTNIKHCLLLFISAAAFPASRQAPH